MCAQSGAMRWMMSFLFLVAGCAGTPATAVVSREPPPQPYCTRTLGVAECFADPAALPDHPDQLMDTPVRAPAPAVPWWKKVADHWN